MCSLDLRKRRCAPPLAPPIGESYTTNDGRGAHPSREIDRDREFPLRDHLGPSVVGGASASGPDEDETEDRMIRRVVCGLVRSVANIFRAIKGLALGMVAVRIGGGIRSSLTRPLV